MSQTTVKEYLALQRRLDREIERLSARLSHRLTCRPGCDSCCTLESVLPVEAQSISRAVAALPAPVRRRLGGRPDHCPLLVDGLCAVYAHRPFICRTHGLPVGYADPDAGIIEVSACPRNFPPDARFTADTVLQMDPFTAELQRLSRQLTADGPPRRVHLRDLL